MFITAVCVLFLIKLRWPRNKKLYDKQRCSGPLKERIALELNCYVSVVITVQ